MFCLQDSESSKEEDCPIVEVGTIIAQAVEMVSNVSWWVGPLSYLSHSINPSDNFDNNHAITQHCWLT